MAARLSATLSDSRVRIVMPVSQEGASVEGCQLRFSDQYRGRCIRQYLLVKVVGESGSIKTCVAPGFENR